MGVVKRNESEDKLTTNSQCQEFNIVKICWIKFGTYPNPLRLTIQKYKRILNVQEKSLLF